MLQSESTPSSMGLLQSVLASRASSMSAQSPQIATKNHAQLLRVLMACAQTSRLNTAVQPTPNARTTTPARPTRARLALARSCQLTTAAPLIANATTCWSTPVRSRCAFPKRVLYRILLTAVWTRPTAMMVGHAQTTCAQHQGRLHAPTLKLRIAARRPPSVPSTTGVIKTLVRRVAIVTMIVTWRWLEGVAMASVHL
jgi:hypothetical protein